ncbi:MAG: transposase [Actinobacteria bacterium]|nr:transposase [Actinomycetota bacterium]
MPRKHYTPEQIINSLREAEVLLSQGNTTAQAARHLGITEQTYCRWRKEYGPTNYAGLALIVLSIILFILDLKLNLGGILSLAGIASLIIGSFMLIDTSAPFLQIAKSLIKDYQLQSQYF